MWLSFYPVIDQKVQKKPVKLAKIMVLSLPLTGLDCLIRFLVIRLVLLVSSLIHRKLFVCLLSNMNKNVGWMWLEPGPGV